MMLPELSRPAAALSYPQQWRSHALPWWRPWLALFSLVLLCALVLAAYINLAYAAGWDDWSALSPSLLLWVVMLPLMALIPCARLAVRWGGGLPPSVLDSTDGRFDWRAAVQGTLLATLLLTPLWWFPPEWVGLPTESLTVLPDRQRMAALLLMLVLVPLQAAGEEYLFRGFVVQWLGRWCRSRRWAFWLPLLASSLLFALFHGEQDPLLFFTRFGLGALFFWLVWVSGQLAYAVALHTANNLIALTPAILAGTLAEDVLATDIDSGVAAIQLLLCLLAATALALLHHRRNRRQA